MTTALLRGALRSPFHRLAMSALALTLAGAACDVPPEEEADDPDEFVVAPLVAEAAAPAMTLQNRDSVPFPTRLVMSVITNDSSQLTHKQAVLRVSSTGTDPLVISKLDVTAGFALAPKPALPLTIAAGSFADLTLALTATSGGKTLTGTLTITSNVPGAAPTPVELAGTLTKAEGGNEPSFVQVIGTFGYKTTIVASGQQLNQHGKVAPVGDEVISPFWKVRDASKPVDVKQLAAFHTRGGAAPISWYAKGSTTLHTIVTSGGDSAQTLLPRKKGSTTAAAFATFAPTGVFGLKVSGEFSDPTRNNIAKDMQNGCTGPCGHHVRFWPAKDRSGKVITGAYLVGMDSSSVNYDYQDDVYLISNITPE